MKREANASKTAPVSPLDLPTPSQAPRSEAALTCGGSPPERARSVSSLCGRWGRLVSCGVGVFRDKAAQAGLLQMDYGVILGFLWVYPSFFLFANW